MTEHSPATEPATETVALNYRETGSGQPVLLLHGMFGSLGNLGMLARALADNYRVIQVDARNHGDSPHHHEMNYPAMASDITRLLDTLEIEQAHLIGHSMGGKIAMQTALGLPDRVSKLIVIDIAPVNYRANDHTDILKLLMQLYRYPPASRKEADNLLAQIIDDQATRAFLLTNLVRNPTATGDQSPFRIRLNMDAITDNYYDKLTLAPEGQPFSGPTLFFKGGQSPYIQEKHRPAIAQLFPNSQLEVIEDATHWLHAEKPELLAKLVHQFLS